MARSSAVGALLLAALVALLLSQGAFFLPPNAGHAWSLAALLYALLPALALSLAAEAVSLRRNPNVAGALALAAAAFALLYAWMVGLAAFTPPALLGLAGAALLATAGTLALRLQPAPQPRTFTQGTQPRAAPRPGAPAGPAVWRGPAAGRAAPASPAQRGPAAPAAHAARSGPVRR